MPDRRALLIVNRNARQGRQDIAHIGEALRAHGMRVDPAYSASAERTAALIRERGPGVDLIVLGGGDGTLRAAIEPLLACGTPLGVLPLGTANDLARGLGIPLDPVAAAEAIGTGVEHRIDLGRVNGHYFFNASGIGMGADVTRQLSGGLKRRWGVLSYARAVWGVVRKSRSFGVTIVCDGQVHHERSVQVTVGNGRHYGGGMTVHAEAALDDSRLDVFSLRPRGLWRLTRLLPALRRGTHAESDDVATCHGRRIELRTRRPRSVTADGEVVSRTPAMYEVVPAALPVIVPALARSADGLRHVAQ